MQEIQETPVQSLVRKIAWSRKWQPTPVLLPGKIHGHRSLLGLQCTGSQGFGHDWAHTIKHKERQFQKHPKSLLCTLENFNYLHHYFVFAQLQILHALYFFPFRHKLPCGTFLQPKDYLLAFLVMQVFWKLSFHTSLSHFFSSSENVFILFQFLRNIFAYRMLADFSVINLKLSFSLLALECFWWAYRHHLYHCFPIYTFFFWLVSKFLSIYWVSSTWLWCSQVWLTLCLFYLGLVNLLDSVYWGAFIR